MRSIAFPISLLSVFLSAILISGCDVIRVDAPTETEKVLSDLYSATSVSQAEAAVRRFLVAAEIGSRWSDSPLRHYELTNKEVRTLAEAQLAYNRGNEEPVLSAEAVYHAASRANEIRGEGRRWMRTPLRPIYASAGELCSVVQAFAKLENTGLATPEQTLVSTIVAQDGKLSQGTEFVRETSLSPIQQFAYSVWLAHYGPRIIPFEHVDEVPAASKMLSLNFFLSGGGACDCFSDPSDGGQLRWMLVRYLGAQNGNVKVVRQNPDKGAVFFEGQVEPGELFVVRNASGTGDGINSQTIGNNVNFFLNGQLVTNQGTNSGEIHTSCSPLTVRPGETIGLGTGSAPNRIQLGAPFIVLAAESRDRPGNTCEVDCLSVANNRLEACLAVPGSVESVCRADFDAYINACHYQGSVD